MKDILKKVYRDLKYSARRYSKLHKAIKDDFKFANGEQWEESDVAELRRAGIKALTINKIKPIIKLITGIERQSKSDYVGLPEGGEDTIVGNMVTKLLKNISKCSSLSTKTSIQFKNGAIGGVAYIEPYIDYSYDLINGTLKFNTVSGTDVFPDPDGKEYDLSDHKFLIKITKDLSREDLELLFPDQKKKIDNVVQGKIDFSTIENIEAHIQGTDYPELSEGERYENELKEKTYDLIDYYYKELRPAYYIADTQSGVIKEVESKEKAEEIASQIETMQVIEKKVPAIMHYQVVGKEVFYDDVAWSYPRWKKYPIIPFFAEYNTEDMDDKSLSIQGVVRVIKDLQEEFNKRRTQELRHLNASANSGFDIEEGQLSPEGLAHLKKYGSSPGFVVERRKGSPPLGRITPMPLSQGHRQLAEENAEDLKQASGVNPDLLANDSGSDSGRAILLKQRQGLVMVQEMLDNYGITKKLIGQFMLSQLKEIFTVESALRVIGDDYIKEVFTVPVTSIIQRGLDKIAEGKDNEITELEKANMLQYPNNSKDNPVVDENNQLVPAIDFDEAIRMVNQVLNDSELGKYDVSIGEGAFNETVRLSNFLSLTELAQQGVPIPPKALIEMSLIPEDEKKKIIAEMEMQQQIQMQQAQANQQKAEQTQ